MEKPFGTDLASAVALNARLHEVFAEEQFAGNDGTLGVRLPNVVHINSATFHVFARLAFGRA